MSDIAFSHLSYCYPDRSTPTLRDITATLPDAALTLVVGTSGAGKSTLLRTLNGLVPHFTGGTLTGKLTVLGVEPYHQPPQTMGQRVGFVFQDPEAQAVMERVEDEIAFGMEQQGLDRATMRLRVEEVLDLLGIAALRQRPLATLSGGERQRVAIASVLALRPPLLVLDEPTSQLDPLAADEVFQALVRLNQDMGLTVVVAEHRLERVLPYADHLLAMSDGQVEEGAPRALLARLHDVPPLVEIGRRLGWEPLPLTIKEARAFSRRVALPPAVTPTTRVRGGGQAPLVRAVGVTVQYGTQAALHNAHLELFSGEIVGIMGRNGAGKSTLLRSLVGLVRPQSGQIQVGPHDARRTEVATLCRTVGYLPQNPNDLLFADTVREEWLFSLRTYGLDAEREWGRRAEPLLDTLGLHSLLDRYPRDLSAGERQRVALGTILLVRPAAILLDEPTRGLDMGSKQRLAALLRQWASEGMAMAIVTHDVEFVAQIAERVMVMAEGQIVSEGDAASVLGASPLFAPQAARLFPEQGWLTPQQLFEGLGV